MQERVKEKKLPVPFRSQYEILDREWNTRSCGIACLAMVFEYYGTSRPNLLEYVREGEKNGGYQRNIGWKHEYFVSRAIKEGFTARRVENMSFGEGVQELCKAIDNGIPPIVSGWKHFFGSPKGSHLVVLTGYKKEKMSLTFFYHDPEMTDEAKGSHCTVSPSDFEHGWRRMAIFISNQPQ